MFMSAVSPVSTVKASVMVIFFFRHHSLCVYVSMYVNSCVGLFGVHTRVPHVCSTYGG